MTEVIMAQPYRRLSIGQILERVYQLCRGAWKTFVAIALVPPATFFATLGITFGVLVLPYFARMPKNMSEAQNSQMAFLLFVCMLVVMLMCSAVFAPSIAAGCYAAVHADLGKRVTFKESYSFALKRYVSYLALSLTMMLIGTSPMIVFELLALVPAISLRNHTGEPGPAFLALIPVGIIGFIGVYVLSIVLMLRLSLVFPACVTESLTVLASIRRSSQLTRGAKGRVFLILLVVYAACYAGYLVGMVIAAIWFAFLGLISFTLGKHLPNVLAVIVGAASVIGVVCMMMFFMACSGAGFTTALGVIYDDQRRSIDRPPVRLDAVGVRG